MPEPLTTVNIIDIINDIIYSGVFITKSTAVYTRKRGSGFGKNYSVSKSKGWSR